MYQVAKYNTEFSELLDLIPCRFQPFPIHSSFIPAHRPFDINGDLRSILLYNGKDSLEVGSNPESFWQEHFHTRLPSVSHGQGFKFDGFFATNDVSISIIKPK